MAPDKINVNKADINSSVASTDLPLDVMGLFFFAYRDFVRDADALLERQGFGRAHHRVLYFVNLKPGLPVATILDVLKITKQSLARVLRQLIDNGYIEQKTGPSDRRQRLLYPTAKGRDLFETLSATQSSRIEAALAPLQPDARSTILKFFVGMVETDDRPLLNRLHLTDNIR
ncbi:MarR family winged helix-turn-helix transcriptional regulator [Paradevosia shaoguanensis]|uniref:MarR family transcriptional regulator n=1 Tax=Paradevosia shaoguanensis TaxID=1335043 RepID=A0AA41QQA5_9HYPH|nr:MarR family transcriptional regulator [Paradevosia shaoguanensis]MCF1743551.1 MarR family transcriptional regulator [Paradevosia shaoguanensis]MCI0128034.1 MarR family transcriptional regulator [Paradevosia shaoguanensis]CDP50196.1 HTH-type transcriptional regulator PetP [Devosia sp. DBB001]